MKFILICTEGEVSEPVYLSQIKQYLFAQAPREFALNVEIVTLPLSGNQGHAKLIEKSDQCVRNYLSFYWDIDDKNEEYEIEKWLICDNDNMNRNGVAISDLQILAEKRGYRLVINKPNFEFFLLLHFVDYQQATQIKPMNYRDEINAGVERLNNESRIKGFSELMLLPNYSHPKKRYFAENFFGKLICNHPEVINKIIELPPIYDYQQKAFTQMPDIIKRLKQLTTRS